MINQMSGIASHTQTDSEIANIFLKYRFQEFVLSSLRASPLINPLLTPGGWQEE